MFLFIAHYVNIYSSNNMNLLKKYLNTLSLCLSGHMSNPKASFFIFFLFFRQQRRQANKTPCCVISLTTSASLPVSATILILSATIFCLGFIHQMVTTWKQLVPHSLSYGALTQSLQASERRKSLLETKDTNFIPLLFKSVPLSSRSKDWAMIFQQAAAGAAGTAIFVNRRSSWIVYNKAIERLSPGSLISRCPLWFHLKLWIKLCRTGFGEADPSSLFCFSSQDFSQWFFFLLMLLFYQLPFTHGFNFS